MMVLNLLEEKICWFTLVITLTIGLAMAQDTNPVCPPPVPICRSYETSSCEWSLNMIPVYVCRTDLASILGIGAGQGCQQRPQNILYQQPITSSYNQQPSTITYTQQPVAYNQQTVMPSFVQPQPLTVYKTYTSRQPAQFRQAIPPQFVGREVDQSAQGSPQNGQADSGSQPVMFSARAMGQGAARDASSPNGQQQSQQGHGQKPSGNSAYQGVPQPAPVPPQSSYSGGQSMNNEGAE